MDRLVRIVIKNSDGLVLDSMLVQANDVVKTIRQYHIRDVWVSNGHDGEPELIVLETGGEDYEN